VIDSASSETLRIINAVGPRRPGRIARQVSRFQGP
jgi:hypothetical protein